MALITTAGVHETLADLKAIAQHGPSTGATAFNASHVSMSQRSIYRSGMKASLPVSAGVLEALARAGHIHWVFRGIGIDIFILASNLLDVEPAECRKYPATERSVLSHT